MKTKAEILARIKEILDIDLDKDDADVDTLTTELRNLQDDLEKYEETNVKETRQAIKDALKRGADIGRIVEGSSAAGRMTDPDPDTKRPDREERGKALLEKRAITIGSGDIALSTIAAPNVNDTWNPVSGLLDSVDREVVIGAESYDQPFIAGYGEGEYTAENADYADAEPNIKYAKLAKTFVTAYAEISRMVQKLPAAAYAMIVESALIKAVRRKLAREIMIGNGADGHLSGIFNTGDTNPAMDEANDVILVSIENDTLDEIIGSYGGDEDSGEGEAVLILNKEDLKAFSKLRTTTGNKVHEIKRRARTIDEIPYIINSACGAISKDSTDEDVYCMAYGNPKNYKLAVFSDVEAQESADYKFKQGMVAYRADSFYGGNVVVANGFVRVKKGEAA